MPDIKYEITEHLAVLSTSSRGWSKELNLVSWNDRPAKYDLREWAPITAAWARALPCLTRKQKC